MIVMKFGGTSVGSADAINRCCEIVMRNRDRSPFVVVSAMAGVTNDLFESAELALHGSLDNALRKIDRMKTRHRELMPGLERDFEPLKTILRAVNSLRELSPRTKDLIASYGEGFSARIFTEFLSHNGCPATLLDAKRFMITDNAFGQAVPLVDIVKERLFVGLHPVLMKKSVPVMAGYIGATENGEVTTLGRNGSDYSAAIVGAVVGADEIQIWKDVDGIMTADPRIVPEAERIAEISFQEAAELASFGAKVLHPSAIAPAAAKGIPVLILNSYKPDNPGTRIMARVSPTGNQVKSITCKKGITMVTVASDRMLGTPGYLAKLFAAFDRHNVSVDAMATSEISVSVTLDDGDAALPALLKDLEKLGSVSVEKDCALVCLVGSEIKNSPGVGGRILSSVRDIYVLMVSYGASQTNFVFVVRSADADEAVRKLHNNFALDAVAV